MLDSSGGEIFLTYCSDMRFLMKSKLFSCVEQSIKCHEANVSCDVLKSRNIYMVK